MTSPTFSPFAGAPAWHLFGLEPARAAFEYAGMRLMNKGPLPRGDGQHPVVIFPGLAADQRSIGPLKDFCDGLDYAAHDCIQDGDADHTENIEVDDSHCGLGWNTEVLSIIADRLRQPLHGWQRHGRATSF